MLGALLAGLGPQSRTIRAIKGPQISLQEELLALIYDRLTRLTWMLSEDGRKRINVPSSLYEALTAKDETAEKNVIAFESGDDFDAAFKQKTGGTEENA